MKLTIDNLKNAGGFVAARPVEREITWASGDDEYSATVFVRPLSYASAVSDIISARMGADALAARIAACIVDEAGEPIFTPGDITGEADPERGPLNHALTMALLTEIGEVSRLGKARAKSTKKTSSGTS